MNRRNALKENGRRVADTSGELSVRNPRLAAMERPSMGSLEGDVEGAEEVVEPRMPAASAGPPLELPEPPPSPFDERIEETRQEVEAFHEDFRGALEGRQAAHAAMAAHETERGEAGEEPDPPTVGKIKADHDDALQRQLAAEKKHRRAKVRLSALQAARERWQVAQW